MTAAVVPFDFAGQQIRGGDAGGQAVLVGKDVCDALGIVKYRDALAQLDEDERVSITVDTPGGPQVMTAVTEGGIWSLAFIARSPQVKPFRRWVTHDVLPAIRRTGFYSAPAVPVAIDAAMLRQIAEAMEAKDQQIAVLTPRAEVADKLLDATTDMSVADAAKVLTRAGATVGRDRLFTVLSHLGWIYRAQGDRRWRVYQRAIAGGWLSVLPGSHYHPRTGELVLDVPQVRVTPKGLQRLTTELSVAA